MILQRINSALGKWHSRFNPFLDQSRHRLDIDFQTTAIIMKLHATVAMILPTTLPAEIESIHDQYTTQFAYMVSEAKRMKAMAYRDPMKRTNKVTFGFNLGITPVLYLIASRYRDPYLRQSAIEQVRAYPCREGRWDSATAAQIADRIMTIEEGSIPHVKTCKDIPENRRIRLLSTDAHPHNDRMRLYFVRSPYDPKRAPIEEDCVIWHPAKRIFEDDASQIQFWTSIYCTTFSGPSKRQDSIPAVRFPKDPNSSSPFTEIKC